MTGPHRLLLAPGTGVVWKLEHVVVFMPKPDRDFDPRCLSTGDPVTSFLEAMSDHQAGSVGFGLVSWHPHLEFMVAGGVELRTDHPSLPALTGAEGQSWSERRIRSDVESLTVAAGAPNVDGMTDLVLGSAPAGGFALHLNLSPSSKQQTDGAGTVHVPEISTPHEVAATPEMSQPEAIALDPMAILGEAKRSVGVTSHTDESTPIAESSAQDDVLAHEPDDPHAPLDEELTFVPDHTPSASEVLPQGAALNEGDTLARTCPDGHPNPRDAVVCRMCRSLMPTTGGECAIAQPTLGVIRVETADEGDPIVLQGPVLIGRNPSADGDETLVTLTGERISRMHARLDCRGWSLELTDLGSTNGTFVSHFDGDSSTPLEPHQPVRIHAGATIQIGSHVLRVNPPPGAE